MSRITIKNVSTATVYINDPETRLNRELKPGRELGITDEQYENFTFDTGFLNILRNGFIKVSGLKEDEKVEDNIVHAIGKDIIKNMLESHDITSFAKFIPDATPADKEAAVEIARELKITDNAFTALIKKYCGVDIINAISIQHQANGD